MDWGGGYQGQGTQRKLLLCPKTIVVKPSDSLLHPLKKVSVKPREGFGRTQGKFLSRQMLPTYTFRLRLGSFFNASDPCTSV